LLWASGIQNDKFNKIILPPTQIHIPSLGLARAQGLGNEL
jgi:hypothetical protein